MITIATFLNPEEAKVARSFLVANGIEASILGEESLSVMPHIGMGAKSYQLIVDNDDEATAKGLLADVEEAHSDIEDETAERQRRSDKKHLFLWLAVAASIFVIFVGNSYSQEIFQAPVSATDYIACWFRNLF
ncbi:MAG: DUF2007 domain-containing protein [Aquisalinus sp.]|nr:DUF2007 domain-containing protein [Aquisalinus sp.]